MFNWTNALLGAAVFLLFYNCYLIAKTRQQFINMIIDVLQKVDDFHKSEVESLQYLMNTVHFNSLAARHTLNALRPYVISIMNNAAKRDDFKEAQICKDMLQQMDELIKKPV